MSGGLLQLKEILAHGEAQLVSKQEMSVFLKAIMQYIKEWREKHEREVKECKAAMRECKDEMVQETKELASEFAADTKKTASLMTQNMREQTEKARKEIESLIPPATDLSVIEKKLSEIKPTLSLEDVEKQIPSFGMAIRNALELLTGDERLELKAIKGAEEKIEELKGVRGGGTGGGGMFSAAHFPLHEDFTMNGSDTSVTLSAGVAAGGNAIFVRYVGQMLDMIKHYTVSGNKVSFTFAPEKDQVISITYWP